MASRERSGQAKRHEIARLGDEASAKIGRAGAVVFVRDLQPQRMGAGLAGAGGGEGEGAFPFATAADGGGEEKLVEQEETAAELEAVPAREHEVAEDRVRPGSKRVVSQQKNRAERGIREEGIKGAPLEGGIEGESFLRVEGAHRIQRVGAVRKRGGAPDEGGGGGGFRHGKGGRQRREAFR